MSEITFATEKHIDLTKLWGRVEGYKVIPPHLYPNIYSFEDLRGKRAGNLVFVAYLGKIKKNRPGRWLVRCDCGKHDIRAGHIFKRGSADQQKCSDCTRERMRRG